MPVASEHTDDDWPDPHVPTTVDDLGRRDWARIWLTIIVMILGFDSLVVFLIAGFQGTLSATAIQSIGQAYANSSIRTPIYAVGIIAGYVRVTGGLPRTEDGLAWTYIGAFGIAIGVFIADALVGLPVTNIAIAVGVPAVVVLHVRDYLSDESGGEASVE